ncbi:hypothetical protein SynA18461_00985 [Synechococcus sp. A18-46.1]|nr:hypothetical protein SynA18461_00985 [Synechococcus sp. A18-46.1]
MTEGLPQHSAEAIRSSIKRLRVKEWLLGEADPEDLRSCLMEVVPKFLLDTHSL